MENKLKGEKYYTTDLWLRRGSNPPKNIKNKIKNMSIKKVRINDQDKANERNYRPRFLKSNPYPYVPVFGDQKEAVQEDEPSTNATVDELMGLIDDDTIQESDFELLVDAVEELSGPEQIMLNRRLFQSASRGAQKMLQILNPAAEPREDEMKEITIEPEQKKNKKNRILDELSPYNNFGNDEVEWEKNNGLKIDSRQKLFKDLSDEAMEFRTPRRKNKLKPKKNKNTPDTWGKESQTYNPLTGRLIKIGGNTYNRLRDQGVI
jgi:hypothetical protein